MLSTVLQGLTIIHRHAPDAYFAAEHDQIWCCEADEINLSPDELEEMESLGWFVDEEVGSWSFYV